MSVADYTYTLEARYSAKCEECFGLCCVALPYAKSADFAFDKDGGQPCRHLQNDFRCGIHTQLRSKGFKGCTVYECYGAGQKVSQQLYSGIDWRHVEQQQAQEMFAVLPVVQQLHEMLYYLQESLMRKEVSILHEQIEQLMSETEALTLQSPASILKLDVNEHRKNVNEVLIKVSAIVRAAQNKTNQSKRQALQGRDYIGANLNKACLIGASLRGVLLIGADLTEAELRGADFIGADMRDANLRGADLSGGLFLTQAQINSALGDKRTKLPAHLEMPSHWLDARKS
ncbi:pentapeptide repeat-containing protein [Paenibacillus sp. FSL W7-1287]|uniref:pentapeptide repeat-containing protein n=1 Tax=Paenibacillus sp. FSL W7-1287 TaxID=2954538 RepID=UPI0030F62900